MNFMSFMWEVLCRCHPVWVPQAAPAGTKAFRGFGEQQHPWLLMGAVQVDLLLVSQLSHGGMLGTLASASLCCGVWAGFVLPAQILIPHGVLSLTCVIMWLL